MHTDRQASRTDRQTGPLSLHVTSLPWLSPGDVLLLEILILPVCRRQHPLAWFRFSYNSVLSPPSRPTFSLLPSRFFPLTQSLTRVVAEPLSLQPASLLLHGPCRCLQHGHKWRKSATPSTVVKVRKKEKNKSTNEGEPPPPALQPQGFTVFSFFPPHSLNPTPISQ